MTMVLRTANALDHHHLGLHMKHDDGVTKFTQNWRSWSGQEITTNAPSCCKTGVMSTHPRLAHFGGCRIPTPLRAYFLCKLYSIPNNFMNFRLCSREWFMQRTACPNYTLLSVPRNHSGNSTCIGGGTGFLIREPFTQLPTSHPDFSSNHLP